MGHLGHARPWRAYRWIILGTLLAACAGALSLTAPPALATTTDWPSSTFTIYLAPAAQGGSDLNSGLGFDDPISSLSRAQQVLWQWRPNTDVEIRILAGTYIERETTWRYYVPGHTITFMPYDYVNGRGSHGADHIAARPVFRNAKCGATYCPGSFFTARLPVDKTDPMYAGGTSGLRFLYLSIQGYQSAGISFTGDSERTFQDTKHHPALRKPGSKGLNGNRFEGLEFRGLGNRWSGGRWGYGAVVLTNSSDNVFVDNTFANIENTGHYAGYIHGLYITHFSSRNVVRSNTFTSISGDPVKVRDRSNGNLIEFNTFRRTGAMSYYRDEFCDARCARANHMAQQCPSYGNRFLHNRLLGGYARGHLPAWSFGSGSYPYSSRAVCAVPRDVLPLQTLANSRR